MQFDVNTHVWFITVFATCWQWRKHIALHLFFAGESLTLPQFIVRLSIPNCQYTGSSYFLFIHLPLFHTRIPTVSTPHSTFIQCHLLTSTWYHDTQRKSIVEHFANALIHQSTSHRVLQINSHVPYLMMICKWLWLTHANFV